MELMETEDIVSYSSLSVIKLAHSSCLMRRLKSRLLGSLDLRDGGGNEVEILKPSLSNERVRNDPRNSCASPMMREANPIQNSGQSGDSDFAGCT